MTDTQRDVILAIRNLFEKGGRFHYDLPEGDIDFDELKETVNKVKEWCRFKLTKVIRKQIGKGAFGTVFKSCINKSCNPGLILRVVEYDRDFDSAPKNERPENAEWLIHNELFLTLDKYDVDNITIPIYSYSCKVSSLLPEVKDKLIDSYVSPRCVRVTFTDFANGGSLDKSMENLDYGDNQLLHIILQVLLTLCTIYKDHPNYRHNDLHIGNLLVKHLPNDSSFDFKYRDIDGKDYVLMGFNTLILLNDFDYNSIYPTFKNAKVTRNFPNVDRIPSPYYDVHKFINSLLSIPNESSFSKVSDETMNFLKEIIPSFLRGRKKGNYTDFYQIDNSSEFNKQCKENNFKYENYTPHKLVKHEIFKKILDN